MKQLTFITSCLCLTLSMKALSDARGNSTFSDSANVCLSLGLQASITGLDDFELKTEGISGSAGALYEGSEEFRLESNGGVRVLIDTENLTNDDSTIRVNYLIDNFGDQLITPPDEIYDETHHLFAKARLGVISAQKAGNYQGTVTLTVVPDYSGSNVCNPQVSQYPNESYWATMAFEDLYPSPGDADYNDMVVNFRIVENYNSENQIETINMEFVPVARGAGFNHSLMLSLDGEIDGQTNANALTDPVFTGGAEVSATYTNLDNGISYTKYFSEGQDITIFSNTRSTLAGFANVYSGANVVTPKWTTSVNVSLNDPDANVMGNLTHGIFNYRPYLSVHNTGQEIDLASINPENGMIDRNGYPFGLIVPSDWAWPAEKANINDVYPYFEEYRQWLANEIDYLSPEAAEWFNYPSSNAGTRLINLDTAFLEGPE
jgi:LruC domain-containing protein